MVRHRVNRSLFRQHSRQDQSRYLRQHPGQSDYFLQRFDRLTKLSSQTSLLRALPTFVPVLLFPAMNTHMFTHPLTAKQLKMVRDELGYEVYGPIGKRLACGDIGSLSVSSVSHFVC